MSSKSNNSQFFRSTVFVPKGSEIFTTYIWPHLSTRKRRNSLRNGWHFSCTCPRCSDPVEMGALTSAILCKACDGGYFLHENPVIEEPEVWMCHKCQIQGDTIQLNKIVENFASKLEDIARNDLQENLE